MRFQLVIIKERLFCMGFLTIAAIEHHPVFQPKQKLSIQKNYAEPLKMQNLISTKSDFFFEISKLKFKKTTLKSEHTSF